MFPLKPPVLPHWTLQHTFLTVLCACNEHHSSHTVIATIVRCLSPAPCWNRPTKVGINFHPISYQDPQSHNGQFGTVFLIDSLTEITGTGSLPARCTSQLIVTWTNSPRQSQVVTPFTRLLFSRLLLMNCGSVVRSPCHLKAKQKKICHYRRSHYCRPNRKKIRYGKIKVMWKSQTIELPAFLFTLKRSIHEEFILSLQTSSCF